MARASTLARAPCLIAFLLATLPSFAVEQPTVLVVLGAEGTPEFGAQFSTWADRWKSAAARGKANFILVGAPESSDSPTDKQKLQERLSKESTGTSPLWLVLIGHGTYDGREAKFNLRSDDVSDAELAEWLKTFKRPLAFINCTSSSAPFLGKLSGPDRVLITSTRSGAETSFSRFGDPLSASIADPGADLDKDGQTSLLEAFLAASHRTEEFYKQAARLSSEHALLDDNGDKLGVGADWFQGTRATRSAKAGAPIDGLRAHQWHLLLSESEQAMPPELRTRRDEIELQVEALRAKKATMPEGEYYRQLEDLLIQLAKVYASPPAASPGGEAAQ